MTLKSYVLGPERDFQAELLEKKVSASNQFSDLVDLAKSQKRIDLEDLDDSLQQARKLWPLREDHAYYIDQQSNAFARLLILKFANSLVKNNVIPNPNDIFHLELDEIKQAVADPSVGLTTTIEQRKLDFNNFRREVPPRFLGTMYTDPPIIEGELSKFFNPVANTRSDPMQERSLLRGTAGSPGIHTGPARVILTPESFDSVEPGDVLVTRTTNPSWAPLFGTIGALVADSGGVLSHGAIVARELSLPAVMGTKVGTSAIKTGDIITVDGNTGTVTIG